MSTANCFEEPVVYESQIDGNYMWECHACGTWADGFHLRFMAEDDALGCLMPATSVRGESGPCMNGHDCTGPHVYLPW